MKKRIATALAVVLCLAALCACTPKVDDLKKKYQDKDYLVVSISSGDLTKYGIESEDMEYGFMATKLVENVFVVAFKKSDKAKDFYDSVKEKFASLTVKKKGNAVFFGSEGAVNVGA